MIYGCKGVNEVGKLMEVISNGGVTFLQGGQLIVYVHGAGLRMGYEHSFQCVPDFARHRAFDDIGENCFRERWDESTKNELVLGLPGSKIRIGSGEAM